MISVGSLTIERAKESSYSNFHFTNCLFDLTPKLGFKGDVGR